MIQFAFWFTTLAAIDLSHAWHFTHFKLLFKLLRTLYFAVVGVQSTHLIRKPTTEYAYDVREKDAERI